MNLERKETLSNLKYPKKPFKIKGTSYEKVDILEAKTQVMGHGIRIEDQCV